MRRLLVSNLNPNDLGVYLKCMGMPVNKNQKLQVLQSLETLLSVRWLKQYKYVQIQCILIFAVICTFANTKVQKSETAGVAIGRESFIRVKISLNIRWLKLYIYNFKYKNQKLKVLQLEAGLLSAVQRFLSISNTIADANTDTNTNTNTITNTTANANANANTKF